MKVLLRIFLRVWRRIWCTSRETYLRFHPAEAWKVFTTGFNGYSNNSKFSRNHELIRFQYCIIISNFRFHICNHLSRHCLWNHFVRMLCLPKNISNIFNLQKQEGVVKSVHICSKEILHCTQKITTFGPYDSEDTDLKVRNAVLGRRPILHNPRWVPRTFG